jgi:hypothetical protein
LLVQPRGTVGEPNTIIVFNLIGHGVVCVLFVFIRNCSTRAALLSGPSRFHCGKDGIVVLLRGLGIADDLLGLSRWAAACRYGDGRLLRDVSTRAGQREVTLITLTVLISLFSWELEGSMASLLGTGVDVVVRLETSIELARVVSFRHWGDVSLLLVEVGLVAGDGLAPLGLLAGAVLEKKPRMLFCCLPVEGAAFFAVDGVFAGVRAAAAGFSPILLDATPSMN